MAAGKEIIITKHCRPVFVSRTIFASSTLRSPSPANALSASKTLDASSLRSGPSPRRNVFLFVTRGLVSVLFMDAINYWIESKYRATINSLLGFGFRLGFVVMAGLLD